MRSAWLAALALVWASPVRAATPATPSTALADEWVGRPTTLAELLGRADDRAPATVRARARVSLGAAALAAARPLLPGNPSVGAALGVRTNPLGRAFEVQLSASQRIEIAGERGARRRAAGAYDVALHRRLDEARFETHVEVRWAYAKALLARERLRTASLVEEFTQSTVRNAQVRVDAGDLPPLRLRMAEAAFSQATQARREAARVYRAACRDVATTAGWPSNDPIEPVGELSATLVVDGVDALVADALDDHPELVALSRETDSERAAFRAARRDAWPEPTLGVYVAREHEPGTPFASAVGLVTVSIPLPLWRRNQPERAYAEARVRIAEAALATRRYELDQAVRRSADKVSTAALRVRGYARDVLPRFEENLELLQRSFEVGEIDLVEVAVGRQSFLDAQVAALDTWAEYLDALRQLELAVGHEIADVSSVDHAATTTPGR